MTEKKTKKNIKITWLTLLFWLLGLLFLHLVSRIFEVKITVIDMLISNLLAIGWILLINWRYTKEKIYFDWFGFKRFGWLALFMPLYIIAINVLFRTIPSETSLRISLDPFFWLFYILSTSSIPVVVFFSVILPSLLHNWKTDNVIIKSVVVSSFLYSAFQVYLLNDFYGGILETIYQVTASFTLGLICALLYLRTVNIMVPIFFSFIETFCAVILNHIAPIFGSGLLNITFFALLALVIIKSVLRSNNIQQIKKDFEVN